MARFLGRARIWWLLNLSGIWMHVMKKEELGESRRKRDDQQQWFAMRGVSSCMNILIYIALIFNS
jgi:hypothetical protein